MSSVIASRRYASALLSAAEDGGFVDQATQELSQIKEVLDHSRELVHVLRSPVINADKKIHILQEVFRETVGEKVMIFLKLIAKKKRSGMLPEIINEYQKLLDEANGIINVSITSATAMSDEQVSALVAKLSSYTGKTIREKMSLNGDLLGGVTVKIGDTILDGSVRHQLQLLKKTLVSERV
ncbi:MAG: F0F1 ATP synthase subunit delta [Chlorobiaceae bacterium]|jgi:F-type H+-transporting ATPase subunit delta|nr:F0F1 ATP synthase subunit delta [Chlorobiaceae bacterium]